jgi:hypothetical protein
MITIGSNGQKIAYGIKHYNLDTEADLSVMPIGNEVMGSTCFVIETSKYYMLNSQKKWIEITPFGNSVSEGGGDLPPVEPEDDEIIYEGGII